jgi:hypothetical protein
MSILLLVVVLLVVVIVLSRLTWASLGERRSIQHHEQAMDVLRSVAGRPLGSEHAEVGAPQSAHIKSSVGDGADFPAPVAPVSPATDKAKTVREATVQREETIRILRAEPTSAAPDPAAPPPPASAPVASPPAAAAPPPPGPDGDGEVAKPAFVFIADDTGQPGSVTVPPSVADAVRSSARGRWGDGDGSGNGHRGSGAGWGDGRHATGGNGWADGERWGDEPATEPTTLPRPPSIGDQDWAASSRSEARSRSRARTRSKLWGRVLAPVHATGRVASGARGRLGSPRRAVPPAGDTGPADDGWLAAVRDDAPTGEGVKVMIADAPAVPSAPGPEVETTEGGDGHDGHGHDGHGHGHDGHGHDGHADTTAPGPAVPAAPPPDPERDRVTDAVDGLDGVDSVGAAAFDSGQGEQPGLPSVQRAGRRPRFGLVAGLAAIVVVVCVVAGVLVATLSGSSNSTKVPPSRQASPPASTAPAPPPSPLKLVSNDQQGAVYNVNSSQLAVSAVANGRVWLEVIAGSGPSGQVLWQGVLSDGQTQTITNSAPVWMRIGASSNVTVSVNGGGVLLPQSPTTYNLTFSQGQV